MTTPFATAGRDLTARPTTWRTWTGLVVVPLVIMALLTWAFWSPTTGKGTALAAVVNNDEPVTVQGKTVPLGRELAGDLTHDEDSAYDWVLTDSDDARTGLDDGTYAAVVTIPKAFSEQATSSATAKPLDAVRGMIDVDTTPAAGVVDPALSERTAQVTQDTLDRQVVETYLDGLYVGFNKLHDQLGKAVDGADQLADGTSQLAGGTSDLDDGAATLSGGADELAGGAGELAAGTTQLAGGSAELANATAQLQGGAAELSSGLDDAARQTAGLPAATRKLADGAAQVADGDEELATRVTPLANDAIGIIDHLPSAHRAAADVKDLADQCAASGASAKFCVTLDRTADRSTAAATRVDRATAKVRTRVVGARDAVQALATGARQVADGNAELAARSGTLTSGIAQAATGASQLSVGAGQVADGAKELDAGVQRTDDGAHELASGAGDLAAGARELATGAGELDTAAGQVDDGAHELATQLADGVKQIPTYTKAERAHLSANAADPMSARSDRTPFGVLAITLFAAIALWALALVVYLVTQPVPASVLTSRAPTWRIILQAAVPGAVAAATAAVVISVIAVPVLSLPVGAAFGVLGVALLASCTFVALNQALAAVFGLGGRLASLAIVVLAIATGVVSTLPGPLQAITSLLPTHGAVIALRAVVTDGHGLTTGIVELAVWLAVGMLATILVTDRRRYLSPRALRLNAQPSADTSRTG